jgi:alpha-glucosidase (family GH31 glycosyl hydrolase)
MLRYLVFLSWILVISSHGQAGQVVEMVPGDATPDSTVTVYFDATQGDQGLIDYEGQVYAHTGVITLESNNDKDWKHVVADWGTDDDKVLMQREGENLYSLTFHIRSFYQIRQEETVLKLAFVFRNADGSKAGRASDGSDIYVSLDTADDWKYESFTNTASGLKIKTQQGFVTFQPYGPAMVKTRVLSSDTLVDASYGIVKEPLSARFNVDTTNSYIRAHWEELTIQIRKDPLQVVYQQGDTLTVLNDFFEAGPARGGVLRFRLDSSDRFMGGGSRALPLDLSGHKIEFYNQAHYGYANGTANLNTSIPVLVNPGKYALVFNNHHPSSADIGAAHSNQLEYRTQGGNLSFFFLFADSLSRISSGLADLTGHAGLPPLWSLGYIQSRYGYTDRQQAEEVVEQMQANDFSMDALVLDLYWFGGTSDMGDFSWDRSRFPEPEKMIGNFQDRGVQTILITEPYFTLTSDLYNEAASLGHLAANDQGNPYVLYGFWAGDAGLFDMTSPSARDWLWPYYKKLMDMGVAGLWTDLGEPESHPQDMNHEMGQAASIHNLYNNLWAGMLHEKTQQWYPEKRLVNLTRSGYLGMQRLGTYPWSGDVSRSFSGLQAQIPIMLHMAMSGVGYMHSDLGGFTGGGRQPELYTRWMQLGTFSPVMRAHGTDVPTEPIYYDDATQDRVRQAIDMRYTFLPYNYTLAWQYAVTGVPMARPMNYYHPHSHALQSINNQYFWGDDLLVAPVVRKDASQRQVTLPEGRWANYYTGNIHQGEQTLSVEAPLHRIPLFIREGGFLVQSAEQLPHTRAYESDSIRIRHFFSQESETRTGYWYHDDGTTAGNPERGNYNLITMQSHFQQDTAVISMERSVDHLPSMKRQIEYLFYGFPETPGEVRVNGQILPRYASALAYGEDSKAAFWEEPFLYVQFPWTEGPVEIRIEPGEWVSTGNRKMHTNPYQIAVQPNPFADHASLNVTVDMTGSYRISLMDMKGRVVSRQKIHLVKGTHNLPLNRVVSYAENLSPGIYLLMMEGRKGESQVRMVKTSQ